MRRWQLFSWLVLLAACERRLSIGSLLGARDAGSDAAARDGEVVAPDAAVDFCSRTGPLYDVGDGAGAACSDGSVRRAFRFALCSCGDFQHGAPTTIDSFDSTVGAYMPGDQGGSLGLNGSFYPVDADIGGSLWVKGTNGIPLNTDLSVSGNLLDQGQLDGLYAVRVGGLAQVAGPVRLASLSVGKELTVSDGSTVDVAAGAPTFTRADIDVPVACDCNDPLDVPALVASAATSNDNASIGLDPSKSMRALDGAIELTLPCGRYYVDEFYAPNPITLTVTGRVELYIRGSMVADLAGSVQVQLAKGGELDLFIEKGISATNLFQVGSPAAPARTRIYAGGGETLYFAGETTLAASVYAPQGELSLSGPLEVFGAVFVARATASAPLTLHYDRALARDECEPASCDTARDCNVLSCQGGSCQPCTDDSECAAPLRCDRALCLP